VEPQDAEFAALRALFASPVTARSVVRIEVERIADSCGYGVPLMNFAAERTQLTEWAARKGPEGVRAYQLQHNRKSLDGLPALRWPEPGAS
jgi:hypothetical protein